jgi:hypothetical protein
MVALEFVLLVMLAMVVAVGVLERIAPGGPPRWLDRIL